MFGLGFSVKTERNLQSVWKLEFACVCGGPLFLVVNEFSFLLFWNGHGCGLGGIFEFISWTGESHVIRAISMIMQVLCLFCCELSSQENM